MPSPVSHLTSGFVWIRLHHPFLPFGLYSTDTSKTQWPSSQRKEPNSPGPLEQSRCLTKDLIKLKALTLKESQSRIYEASIAFPVSKEISELGNIGITDFSNSDISCNTGPKMTFVTVAGGGTQRSYASWNTPNIFTVVMQNAWSLLPRGRSAVWPELFWQVLVSVVPMATLPFGFVVVDLTEFGFSAVLALLTVSVATFWLLWLPLLSPTLVLAGFSAFPIVHPMVIVLCCWSLHTRNTNRVPMTQKRSGYQAVQGIQVKSIQVIVTVSLETRITQLSNEATMFVVCHANVKMNSTASCCNSSNASWWVVSRQS